jgi:hypothetical protein
MLEQASVSTLSALVKRLTITHVGLVARVVHDIYGLLLNVLNDRDGWSLFASNIRDSISGLPAFQYELSKAMLGSINLSHPNR